MGSVDNVDMTVMAIRERMMQYFKGDTVHIGFDLEHFEYVRPETNSRYQYERRENELADTRIYTLNGVPIVTVSKHPNYTATLHMGAMSKFKQTERIAEELKRFFHDYLGSVDVKEADYEIRTS